MHEAQELMDINHGGHPRVYPVVVGMLDKSEKEAREEHDKSALHRLSPAMPRRQQTAARERPFSLD